MPALITYTRTGTDGTYIAQPHWAGAVRTLVRRRPDGQWETATYPDGPYGTAEPSPLRSAAVLNHDYHHNAVLNHDYHHNRL